MKKVNDVESEYETLQNFLYMCIDDFYKTIKSTIEKQNEPIFKKMEEKKRL